MMKYIANRVSLTSTAFYLCRVKFFLVWVGGGLGGRWILTVSARYAFGHNIMVLDIGHTCFRDGMDHAQPRAIGDGTVLVLKQ